MHQIISGESPREWPLMGDTLVQRKAPIKATHVKFFDSDAQTLGKRCTRKISRLISRHFWQRKREEKTLQHKRIGWVAKLCLRVLGGHSLWGRKTHKQNPGTIPGTFCLCVCFFSGYSAPGIAGPPENKYPLVVNHYIHMSLRI